MTLNAQNVMCGIYEQYCISRRREQLINLATFNLNYKDAAAVMKELKQNGYISKVEKLGQTNYRLVIEDELIEYYES